MEKTDAVVSTVAERLGDKALQYLTSFEELAKQYSPDVIDAALTVVRLHGLQNALQAILVFGALCVGVFLVRKGVRMKDIDSGAVYFMPGFILTLVMGISALTSNAFSLWPYIAIFEPKLYIAYKIFGRFL